MQNGVLEAHAFGVGNVSDSRRYRGIAFQHGIVVPGSADLKRLEGLGNLRRVRRIVPPCRPN